MKKIKGEKKKKQKKNKHIIKNCDDYLIVKNKIYYVNTQSQRAILKKFQNFSLNKIEHNEYNQKEKKIEDNKINTDLIKQKKQIKQKTILQQILHLNLKEKNQIYSELRKQLKIKKVQPNLKYLIKELDQITLKIHYKHSNNIILLNKLKQENGIKQADFQEKFDIINRIVQRKIKLVQKIKEFFVKILNKQKEFDEQAEINLSQLIYSVSSISCLSSQKILSQKQIEDDKNKLMNTLKEKLNLKIKEKQQQIQKSVIQQSKASKQSNLKDKIIDDDLQCYQPSTSTKKQIKIPLIMTRQRKQQIQKQRILHQQKRAQLQIQQRINIQLGYLRLQPSENLINTSLAAISNYLDALTQFLLKNYSNDLIELINMPYGKSAFDKLAQLTGRFSEFDQLPFILDDRLFHEFQKKNNIIQNIQNSQKKQYQKIHNKIIFDCLNQTLNIYRPYFTFNGEIFPWLVTQKGMTFYSINSQNIEEVLDKSKVSILQKAATLCGILRDQQLTQNNKQVYENKRQQTLKKTINSQIGDDPDEWKTYSQQEALIRIEVSNWIVNSLIQDLSKALLTLN